MPRRCHAKFRNFYFSVSEKKRFQRASLGREYSCSAAGVPVPRARSVRALSRPRGSVRRGKGEKPCYTLRRRSCRRSAIRRPDGLSHRPAIRGTHGPNSRSGTIPKSNRVAMLGAPPGPVQRKASPYPFDSRRLGEHDAHDIESRLVPVDAGAAGVIARGILQPRPLFRVHRTLRRTEFVGGARLDLHKGEHRAVPHNQVKFARAGARAVIARHHGAPVPAQVAVRQVFSHAPMIMGRASGAAGRRRRDRASPAWVILEPRIRTPSPCRGRRSTGNIPRTAGNAGND